MPTQGEHRRSTTVAALAAAALLAIAACTGPADPVPRASSTSAPSGSPTPSASPTPTAPAEPELPAQVESVDGAVAMMRYVFELYTYAFATNDASGFEPISADDCTFCSNVRKNVATNRSADHVVHGDAITVDKLSSRPIGDQGYFSIRATITQNPSETRDRAGALVGTSEGGRFSVQAALQWRGKSWEVLEVEATPAKTP
ncbi:DUF6318 family protein [Cellulomonas massiliensis]|uniref:DUF6318 family protein n=1 Tax=Cellulomonas massiliensis TaxID=1465811 RepID=UPI00037903CB|nr:DUF6318 family protein [Cellulomonas massiliensis]